MNSITVVGRLTKDPEIKYLDNGNAVTNLSIADNRKDRGETVTVFWDVAIWGKRAETAAEYLKKGQEVAIAGRVDSINVKGERAYPKVSAHDFTLGLGGGSRDAEPETAPRRAPASRDELPF